MNNSENFSSKNNNNNAQLVLSYELLALLRWLVEHNTDALKRIVSNAITSGLQDELQKIEKSQDVAHFYELQQSITDFLVILEALLIDTLNEQLKQKTQYRKLAPALEKIDRTVCDKTTVSFSIEEATLKLRNNPQANPNELLFKELLRRWKPGDKSVKN